jgi:biopolymer transport protein ExbD
MDLQGDDVGPAPMAQINVTPLVDVMLVLLVVFMVAAPLMATGMHVNLPKAATRPIEAKQVPVVVSVDQEGKVYVDRDPVALETLAAAVKRRLDGRKADAPVLVKGDKGVPYGRVLEVVAAIGAGGVGKVALLTEPPPRSRP